MRVKPIAARAVAKAAGPKLVAKTAVVATPRPATAVTKVQNAPVTER